jgi:hypothetical protein
LVTQMDLNNVIATHDGSRWHSEHQLDGQHDPGHLQQAEITVNAILLAVTINRNYLPTGAGVSNDDLNFKAHVSFASKISANKSKRNAKRNAIRRKDEPEDATLSGEHIKETRSSRISKPSSTTYSVLGQIRRYKRSPTP